MITTGIVVPCVLLGLRVERLAELHDVDAVLAQRGADRRRRDAWPPAACSLIVVRTFFAIGLDLLDLVEADLDRGLATED